MGGRPTIYLEMKLKYPYLIVLFKVELVWEGLRVYQEGLFCLEAHLDRLLASAHTLMFEDIPNKNTIRKAIKQTLEANAMACDTHIRLTLTRGSKITSGMDPRLNQNG